MLFIMCVWLLFILVLTGMQNLEVRVGKSAISHFAEVAERNSGATRQSAGGHPHTPPVATIVILLATG